MLIGIHHHAGRRIRSSRLRFSALVTGFVILAGLYIYAVNGAIVHSFALQHADERISILTEDINTLEAELANLSVGSNLEERARAQGLAEGRELKFIVRDEAVARN